MANVKIIVDSASDMAPEEAQARGLVFLPLTTWFGDREYLDGVTLRHEEFYAMLESSKEVPTTSQLTPYAYRGRPMTRRSGRGRRSWSSPCPASSPGRPRAPGWRQRSARGRYGSWTAKTSPRGSGSSLITPSGSGTRASPPRRSPGNWRPSKNASALWPSLTLWSISCGADGCPRTAAVAGTVLNIKPVIGIEDGQVVVLGKARGRGAAATC